MNLSQVPADRLPSSSNVPWLLFLTNQIDKEDPYKLLGNKNYQGVVYVLGYLLLLQLKLGKLGLILLSTEQIFCCTLRVNDTLFIYFF